MGVGVGVMVTVVASFGFGVSGVMRFGILWLHYNCSSAAKSPKTYP